MRYFASVSVLALCAGAALADSHDETHEHREMGAHVHGTGQLNIAIEDHHVAMEFSAPGADIVGFEYEAETDEDKAAIEAAIAALEAPLSVFALSPAAGCEVEEVEAHLHGEDHEGHDHDDHDHDHDDHDDHKDEDHDHDHDHDHEGDDHDHEGEEHDHDEDHDHDEGDDHDDHDHDGHDGYDHEAQHSEFHSVYMLHCDNLDKLSAIEFGYFDQFPNAQKLEVQVISDSGAQRFDVERDAPKLDLSGL